MTGLELYLGTSAQGTPVPLYLPWGPVPFNPKRKFYTASVPWVTTHMTIKPTWTEAPGIKGFARSSGGLYNRRLHEQMEMVENSGSTITLPLSKQGYPTDVLFEIVDTESCIGSADGDVNAINFGWLDCSLGSLYVISVLKQDRSPMAEDLKPTFGNAEVSAQSYTQGTNAALLLPAATGGDGALSYGLTPAPPPGLTLDAAARTLRGTPTEPQGSRQYTWTARDADGDTASLSFAITVAERLTQTPGGGGGGFGPIGPAPSSDATLSALSLSAGWLAFAPETSAYAAEVPYAVASVTVTPTASDSGATLTVNGVAVASGEPSAAIALPVDETHIPIVVTAPDGTTRTYTVTVTRGPAEVAFLPAASSALHGFVRVVNESDEAGTVTVRAFDDEGAEHGPVTLAIGAGEARHFSSSDLESGNPDKGLSGATGAPEEGHWRLVFESDLAFRALGYARARGAQGFPAAAHDVVAESQSAEGYRYEVAFFNPASNANQASVLRLVNRSEAQAAVTITGTDDAGDAGEEAVTLTLPAGAARRLLPPELELGEGLDGALGDGTGKWRLRVGSDRPLAVMSLMGSPDGHFTNLSTAPDGMERLWLLPSAANTVRSGFVRIVNEGDEAGEVRIRAFDDTGEEYGPLTLALEAGAAVQLNSHDLESGNVAKELTGATGPGQGRWRLAFESELGLRVLGYVRTRGASGFPAAVHDTVAESRTEEGYRYEVAFFNPASNPRQASVLLLVNRSDAEAAEVTVTGTDDAGRAGEAAVTLRLPAGASRRLWAPALESGEGEGLDGALGDGAGKWRLGVDSDRPLAVMSLMRSLDGHLTNLSTAPPASR